MKSFTIALLASVGLAQEDNATCFLGTTTSCSTDVAYGLTMQIAAEMGKMGHTFKTLDSTWIHCSTPCVNQLVGPAADALASAAKSKNDYITLNSAWRSAAQQYLLYRWYQKGTCGIGLAAHPGSSNHEGGRAIDTSSYNYWYDALTSHGWYHSYPTSDPVHYDYSGVGDLAATNLIAYQKLWNLNYPDQKIAEDGVYGPATEKAFYNTRCDGFLKTSFTVEEEAFLQ